MSEAKTTRRLAAVLAADMVGYSRLMEADEEGTINRQRGHRSALIDPTIDAHGGRIVKTMGDGILVEFPSAAAAVACALAVQEGMATREADTPADDRIQYRIGINVGDIIIDGDDILGDGVNVAARIEALSDAGGICVSRGVRDHVGDTLPVAFEDLGEHKVKNLERPVHLFRVRLDDVAGDELARPTGDGVPAVPDKPSIAALPFDNLSGDAEQDYFADGMVEEIITGLSRLNWLFVIARNSSFAYRNASADLRQIAKELGVRYILQGSVRKGGDRMRISGQLIDAATGANLWADRFDGDLADVFDLQDRVTESVIGALEPTLRSAEIERSRRKRPGSLDAYDLYLRALPHAYAMKPDANLEAVGLLERALKLDPGFAPAAAYAAWCYEQRLTSGWPIASEADAERAVELAHGAIAGDSMSGDVMAISGFMLIMIARDYEVGHHAVQRALALSPNTALVSMFGGWANVFAGSLETGLDCFRRSLRLSPSDPQSYFFRSGCCAAHLLAGRYAEAAEFGAQSVGTYADWDGAYIFLAAAHGHMGREDEARLAVENMLRLSPEATVSRFRDSLPFSDQGRTDIIVEGLRKAGLPE